MVACMESQQHIQTRRSDKYAKKYYQCPVSLHHHIFRKLTVFSEYLFRTFGTLWAAELLIYHM